MENIYYIRYLKSQSNVLFFFLQFTVAFIVLTVLSILFYVDLYNEQINPYSKTVMFSQNNLSFLKNCTFESNNFFLSQQSDLHGQMTSSLKDNYWNDNFTTGTNISNEWNHLFIDVSESKIFRTQTFNLFTKTFILSIIPVDLIIRIGKTV